MLGWNPGTEQEIFTREELIQLFDLQKVNKAGARFDPEKARWFNQQYIKRMSNDVLLKLLKPLIEKEQLIYNDTMLLKVISLMKERATFVQDILNEGRFFFEPPKQFDENVVQKKIKPEGVKYLNEVKEIISQIYEFNASVIDERLHAYVKQKNIALGEVMIPIRVALVGTTKGPHLGQIMEIIGKNESLSRIETFVSYLKTL